MTAAAIGRSSWSFTNFLKRESDPAEFVENRSHFAGFFFFVLGNAFSELSQFHTSLSWDIGLCSFRLKLRLWAAPVTVEVTTTIAIDAIKERVDRAIERGSYSNKRASLGRPSAVRFPARHDRRRHSERGR